MVIDAATPAKFSEAALRVRERRDWVLWSLALTVATAFVSLSRWSAYRQTVEAEAKALAQTGQALVKVIDHHLLTAQLPLQRWIAEWPVSLTLSEREQRLRRLLEVIPGGRAARLSDTEVKNQTSGAASPTATTLTLQQAMEAGAATLEIDVELPALEALVATARYGTELHIKLHEAHRSLLASSAPPEAPEPDDAMHWRNTWQPVGAARPLRLLLERNRAAVLRPWLERTAVATAVWVVLFLITGAALALTHRRARRDLAQLREHAERLAEAQRSVQLSDERLRQVVRTSSIGVFEHDHETAEVFTTPEHNHIWGFPPMARPTGEQFAERLHPEDRDRVLAMAAQGFLPGGDGTFDSEHRIVRVDGEVRWIRVRSQTLFEEIGGSRRPRKTVGGVTDITDARLTQDRLQQHAALLDRTQVAIDVRSIDNRVTYWNGGAERLYGWPAAEALGRDAAQLLEHDPLQVEKIREQVLEQDAYASILQERCKDGRLVEVDARFGLLRDAEGRPQAFFSIKTDLTQRLQLEAQLRHAQRLESLGQLTGGVAHDFNNLLTVIIGTVDVLAESLDDRPELGALAEMARNAGLRGAELTHGLLAFARRQPLQPRIVNVNDILTSAQGLWRRTLSAEIELELVLGAGLWPALIDPAQLDSAILNLVINARDAMPKGGRITVETANAHIDQAYADQHLEVSRGQYVMVSLTDTGEGMSSEQLSRAFEPFFTTKGVGKGSGLGLSMVHGFVKQSNGHIKLYSEIGQGTTVRLYLPRARSDAVVSDAPAAAEPTAPGGATVLVVEDDELVRSLAHSLLVSLGYEALLASNGAEALAILNRQGRVDLLFTDVVMPGGMNGRELAERATALRSDLKVLFTSGYTENAIVHQGRLDRGVKLLTKPYRRADLSRALREALSG